jgi:hypothetical protein
MPAVFTKPYAYDLGTSLREKSLILGKSYFPLRLEFGAFYETIEPIL